MLPSTLRALDFAVERWPSVRLVRCRVIDAVDRRRAGVAHLEAWLSVHLSVLALRTLRPRRALAEAKQCVQRWRAEDIGQDEHLQHSGIGLGLRQLEHLAAGVGGD